MSTAKKGSSDQLAAQVAELTKQVAEIGEQQARIREALGDVEQLALANARRHDRTRPVLPPPMTYEAVADRLAKEPALMLVCVNEGGYRPLGLARGERFVAANKNGVPDHCRGNLRVAVAE
jgi:hypothetical protein